MDKPRHTLLDIPLEDIPSVAIRRLIEEVRLDREAPDPARYNRIYNRHNRS